MPRPSIFSDIPRKKRSGKNIDIIVPDELRSEVRAILDQIGKGKKVNVQETVRIAKDGHRVDVSLSVFPIKSRDGTIVGAAKVARDNSEKIRDQQTLAKRSEELHRSNEDLAQFAYVASHDLQEPLRMVATYTELLSEHYKDRSTKRPRNISNSRSTAPSACSS